MLNHISCSVKKYRQSIKWIVLSVFLIANTQAYAYLTAQASACNTAMQASQLLVTGWQMHNRQVASTCAYPSVVNNLFSVKPASSPNAAWRASGCQWTGVDRASCYYTFEGGAANLSLIRFNSAAWRIVLIQYAAD